MTRALNIWWALCAFAAISLGTQPGFAQAAKRVVVMEFEGPGSAAVRNYVTQALEERSEIELVAQREAENAANRLGISLVSPEDYQRLGGELNVSAFVSGSVEKEGGNVRAVVQLRNAASGEIVHEEAWKRKKATQLKVVRLNFWDVMGPHILASSAPENAKQAAPEPVSSSPEPVAEPEEALAQEETQPATHKEKSYAHPAFIGFIGPRLMWRSLTYEGGNTTLSSYKNESGSPAFNLALGGQWYPGAHKRSSFVSNLGLDLDVDYSIGLKSKQANKSLKTTAYEVGAGFIMRIPLGSFEPRIRLGYVRHVFDVDVPPQTPLPAVTYSAVRLGVGAGVTLTDHIGLDFAFAYLPVLSTGELGSSKFAAKATAGAFELNGGFYARVKDAYALRLGVDYRRYAIDFGSSTSATYSLPTSGADSYLRTTLALVYMLPGVTGAAD